MSKSFRWKLTAGLLLAVSLPFVLAYAYSGTDWAFGGFLLNPTDGQTYLAKMQMGWHGAWRFAPPYSAEPGPGAYVYLNYLSLGHLARVLNLPLDLTAHLARLAGVVVMVTGLLRLYQVTLPAGARKTAAVLAAFGAGLGWAVVFFGLLPSDVWVAEIYPFLSAYTNPHFPFGLGLLLWLLALVCGEPGSAPRAARWFLLAVLSLLLAAVQPFGVVVLAVALGSWMALETAVTRRPPGMVRLFQAAAAAVPGGLYLLYQYAAIQADPVLSAWNAQNQTPAPPAWDFILSLSPSLLLAAAAAWNLWRRGFRSAHPEEPPVDSGTRLLLAWAIGGLLLAYVPFPLQRRFLTGYYVPLAGLAALFLAELQLRRPAAARRLRHWAVGLSLPTNGVILLISLFGILSHAPELYLTRHEAAVLGWLGSHASPGAVVLAGPEMGLYVPARSAARVIYGHAFETVDAENQKQAVTAVYTGEVRGAALQRYLNDQGVEWIIYGPREQTLGGTPDFLQYPVVFESGPNRIYAAPQLP